MAKHRQHLNKRGETLAETLCAVLVLALAVALLGAMIYTSYRLEQKKDQATAKLNDAFTKDEAHEEKLGSGEIGVTVGSEKKTVKVIYYGNGQQVVSYRMEPKGGTPGA